MVDTAIVIGTMLATTLLLLLVSGQITDTTSSNLISRPGVAIPAISQTPDTSALQHQNPTSPTPGLRTPSPTPEVTPDDADIQATIDSKFQNDPALTNLDVTATVSNGSVTLTGTVESDEKKTKIERLVGSIRGVRQVDNQIVVVTN